jgi:hypothetical protein
MHRLLIIVLLGSLGCSTVDSRNHQLTRRIHCFADEGSTALISILVWGESDVQSFADQQPHIEFDVEGEGASTVLTALAEGTASIGCLKRVLTDTESAGYRRRVSTEPFVIPFFRYSDPTTGEIGHGVLLLRSSDIDDVHRTFIEYVFSADGAYWIERFGYEAVLPEQVREPLARIGVEQL